MKKATRELAFTGSRLEPDARAICGVPSAEGLRRLAHLLDEHVYRSAA
jgi:hypothetical protein